MNLPDPFAPIAPSIDRALQDVFGFEAFRAGQRRGIEAVVQNNNTLIVMPTGSGKSLCYMLPACVMPGLTLAVSPLIALMKDQADALESFNIPATYINSSLSWDEQRQRLAGMRAGAYKIVLVAPERFKSQVFLDALAGLPIGLFAIDEAHCISQWGHDFRPDYLTLGEVRKQLGSPTTLALTATATPEVQRDIAAQLGFESPRVVVSGFERPNLFFEVYPARSRRAKYERIEALLDQTPEGSKVIYCATRKQVEEVGRNLRESGYYPALYHAGLSDQERDEVQDAFMAGDAPLLIATNAFGMGVDKSDVRAIIHFNIPGSVEAYYQEAGRAGRDGESAHCLLLFNRADLRIHEFFTENSFPDRKQIERLWSLLQKHGEGTHALDADMLADHLSRAGDDRVHPWAVGSALRLLERGGHVAFGQRGPTPWLQVMDRARTRELRVDWHALDARRRVDEDHQEDMVRYATGHTCRQLYLVRYFSDTAEDIPRCGRCDRCCGPPSYARDAGQVRAPIVVSEAAQTVLRKVLSGIARTRGRWGTHVVAAMLRGSRAKKVVGAGLDQLSTHGILSALRQDDLVRLIDVCAQLGLTTQNTHGCVSLTEEGTALMIASEPLPAPVAEVLARHLTSVSASPRRSGAPSSHQAAARQNEPPLPAHLAAHLADSELGETYLRTFALAREGHDYQSIAEQRGLTPSSVLRHFLKLAEHGYPLPLQDHADGRLLPELREVASDWSSHDKLADLKERLSTPCDYDTLKLNLAIVLQERFEHLQPLDAS
ncbi:recombinase RecQ [Lujinxingia litoralis]|uniref:ATP-dependent DNA helicase RecQ n=1 Tax=Lujinxingia litoralis TaxID=2211119 RepID=A0A328C4V4_9DELT|nr:ATP-dependent DNA helicase RecQ [Lujinxingia litoralis]RAL20342.1 recombinase RecQ [Lujinxingia litoralis]